MKKLLLIAVSVMILGCAPQRQPHQKPESESDFGDSGYTLILRTVKHDNHLWVVARTGHGVSILHHPDCPCQKVHDEERK